MRRLGPLAAVTVAGAALAFAFPEPDIAPLAWVAPAPLLFLLHSTRPRRGFALGFLFGVAFFGILLYWISIVGWIAWLILVLMEALYIGAFAAVYSALAPRLPMAGRVLAGAVVWVVLEFVRAGMPVVGFTWGELAQSQHNVGWILRLAGIAGSWGIAFILIAASALAAESLRAWRSGAGGTALTAAAIAASLIAVPLLIPSSSADGRALRVGIVQGNVPRDFTGTVLEKETIIIASHERLTKTLANEDLDLVVWPESAVGLDIDTSEEAAAAVSEAAQAVDTEMIVGGNLDVGPDHYKVMALQISPEGEIADRYQKTHLVPFGEYVPARDALDWLPMLAQVPRDAIHGEEKTIFDVAGGKVAPVISFEGDFGSLVRKRIDGGGQLLVVATNTSTWEDSWASAQHVAFSQVRAAENGVWVAHAALSGISAFIRPDGSIVESTPLWTPTTAVADMRFTTSPTFYARTGDWFPLVCIAMMIGLVLWARQRSGSSRRSAKQQEPGEKGELTHD